jgi:hypothetical protein
MKKKNINLQNQCSRPTSSQSNLISQEKALEKSLFVILNAFLTKFEEINRKNKNSYKKLDFNSMVTPLKSDLLFQIEERLSSSLKFTKKIDEQIEKYIQTFKSFQRMNKISTEMSQFLDKINAEIIRNLNNKKPVDPRGRKITKERGANSVNLIKRSDSSETGRFFETPKIKEKNQERNNFRYAVQSDLEKKEEKKQPNVLYSFKKEGKDKIMDEISDLEKEINEMLQENIVVKNQKTKPQNEKLHKKIAAERKGTTLAQRSQEFLKKKETKEEFMKVAIK